MPSKVPAFHLLVEDKQIFLYFQFLLFSFFLFYIFIFALFFHFTFQFFEDKQCREGMRHVVLDCWQFRSYNGGPQNGRFTAPAADDPTFGMWQWSLPHHSLYVGEHGRPKVITDNCIYIYIYEYICIFVCMARYILKYNRSSLAICGALHTDAASEVDLRLRACESGIENDVLKYVYF